ncbi:hypothetical protein [Mycobacterium sp. 1465703.0]|uniref:hypothetical protein n=1 Tax=Mycobacterium sp. 1465703.0 TaxID=1834078 RepID=UPI0008006937|nr:hypothetical protein [Mycobacterium sp. 1465703.0]OBI95580.1 hypothetical protein A5625_08175 [Mycobacterium sp. 1465703.0]
MPDKPAEATEFASLLVTHKKGLAHDEASRKLREAVEAVQRTGKAASVTVKLSIKPVEKIPNAFRIQDSITASIPEEPRTSMWFGDDKGGLHRNDPNQREFDYDTPADNKTAGAGKDQ